MKSRLVRREEARERRSHARGRVRDPQPLQGVASAWRCTAARHTTPQHRGALHARSASRGGPAEEGARARHPLLRQRRSRALCGAASCAQGRRALAACDAAQHPRTQRSNRTGRRGRRESQPGGARPPACASGPRLCGAVLQLRSSWLVLHSLWAPLCPASCAAAVLTLAVADVACTNVRVIMSRQAPAHAVLGLPCGAATCSA
jgi:hypothetical protein